MIRAFRLAFPVLAVVTAAPPFGWADRAVTPVDSLDARTLRIDLRLGRLDASTHLGGDRVHTVHDRLSLNAALWTGLGAYAELDVPFRMHHVDRVGATGASTPRGVDPLTLRIGALRSLGETLLGGSVAYSDFGDSQTPVLDRMELQLVFGLPVTPAWTPWTSVEVRRFGYRGDWHYGEEVGATLGVSYRCGPLTLAPSLGWRYDPFRDTGGPGPLVRAHGVAAYELASGTTLLAQIENGRSVGGSSESSYLSAMVGVSVALDARPPRPEHRARAPARIRLLEVAHSDPAVASTVLGHLRQLIPRVRLATLEAERAAGGSAGRVAVTLRVAPTGEVQSVTILDDTTGGPGLATALADTLRHQRLPPSAYPEVIAVFEFVDNE